MKSCENFHFAVAWQTFPVANSLDLCVHHAIIHVPTLLSQSSSVQRTQGICTRKQLALWSKRVLGESGPAAAVVEAYLEVFATLKSHIYTKFKQHQLLLGRGQWRRQISAEYIAGQRPIFGLHVSLVASRRSSTTTDFLQVSLDMKILFFPGSGPKMNLIISLMIFEY